MPKTSKISSFQSGSRSGMGLVEIIVGIAIIGGVLWSLGTIAVYTLNVVEISDQNLRATFLASEGIEALKNMRDSSWTSNIAALTASTTYYFAFDQAGEKWTSTTVNTDIDGFSRSFAIYDVYRDVNNDIAQSGTLDAGTKLVTVRVAWSRKGTNYNQSISTYITNFFNN